MHYFETSLSYFIAILGIVCISNNYFTSAQSQCSNPNRRTGYCISIYDCQPLLGVAARKPLQDLDRKFILDSQCRGGLGKAPHVCCTDDTGFLRRQSSSGGRSTVLFPTQNRGISRPRGRGQSSSSSSSPSFARGEIPKPPACGGVTLQNKIYGGDDADLFEFPWLVMLEYRRRSGARSTNCGGSLINQRYIITAAHCVTGAIERDVGPLVGVILGEYDTTRSIDCVGGTCASSVLRVGVEEVKPHESYSDTQVHRHNDIALVRMDRNIIYSDSIRPICLPFTLPNEQLRSGTLLTVAGWGRTLQTQKSAIKQKVQVPLTDQGECRQKFQTRKIQIIDAQVCAGGVYAEDSCDGDSGGPLMSLRQGVWVLEGVVSFGVKCGFEGWPAVHTRVESYSSWINDRIRQKSIAKRLCHTTTPQARTDASLKVCVQRSVSNRCHTPATTRRKTMFKSHLTLQWLALVAIGSLTLADVASIITNDNSRNALVSCDIPNESVRGQCRDASDCEAFLKVNNETSSTDDAVSQPELLRFLEKVQCESESGSSASAAAAASALSSSSIWTSSSSSAPIIVCCPLNGRAYAHPAVEVSKSSVSRISSRLNKSRNKIKKLKRRIQKVDGSDSYNGLFGDCGKQVTNRIYGGEIAELDEYPWLALLVYNTNDYGCSGALIDNQHILTAAHCVKGSGVREKNGLKHVRLGEFNVKTEPDCIEEANYLNCNDASLDMSVERIFVHPDYNEYSADKYDDIAIIRLKSIVPFTHFIMPICLPIANDLEGNKFKPGHMFSVSGWGQTDLFDKYYPNIQSPIKLKLRVPLVPKQDCTKLLKPFGVQVGRNQLCAGGEYAKDTCSGDSGGPLMSFNRKRSRWVAYGVVSYGFTRCGMADHPAVYTNVSAYLDWISDTIKS
ncbi:uncharacterized protein LOC129939382 [Eupeodes corollae]|uniref:uncharacterized protein LOC129939382 n=1 Tax=Eupeodes corollae TaxID=290404 RepID=UPI002491F8FF|nr:uncharacterized protein LOC129939382 [Eupeodes corollae]